MKKFTGFALLMCGFAALSSVAGAEQKYEDYCSLELNLKRAQFELDFVGNMTDREFLYRKGEWILNELVLASGPPKTCESPAVTWRRAELDASLWKRLTENRFLLRY